MLAAAAAVTGGGRAAVKKVNYRRRRLLSSHFACRFREDGGKAGESCRLPSATTKLSALEEIFFKSRHTGKRRLNSWAFHVNPWTPHASKIWSWSRVHSCLFAPRRTDRTTSVRPTLGPYIKDVRTGRGGSPKADIVREVAWIYSHSSSQNAEKGGRGSKIPKILRTSFMNSPK